MSPELVKEVLSQNHTCINFDFEKSNIFSIGLLILKRSLFLHPKYIDEINSNEEY